MTLKDEIEPERFMTSLGCLVTVWPSPDHLDDGVMMELRMAQEGDGRRAEVFLTDVQAVALIAALSRVITLKAGGDQVEIDEEQACERCDSIGLPMRDGICIECAEPEPTWHVRDNVTGKKVSDDFKNIDIANSICRDLNTPRAGGQYGVYDQDGNRAP